MPLKTRDGRAIETGRLRDKIDRGETGDKVAAPDPAAAPLHTDAEAAGTPTAEDDLDELRAPPRPASPRPPRAPAWSLAIGAVVLVAAGVIVAVALL